MAITLEKNQKISLQKKSSSLGEILINLNWNTNSGFWASFMGRKSIDLDLGCLYELKNGSKGVIQALGKHFGSLKEEPYISLDGDDRTGSNTEGENLRVNGDRIAEIKRVLIFTFIYEGAPNWRDTDGVVTVKYPNAEDIIIKMDEYNSQQMMCAIALLENVNDETFSVQKLVQFFVGHEAMDRAFGWNMTWKAARKD